jgi:hypothetical protein
MSPNRRYSHAWQPEPQAQPDPRTLNLAQADHRLKITPELIDDFNLPRGVMHPPLGWLSGL